MEFYHKHTPTTKPKLAMRFFGSKHRKQQQRDQQQQQQVAAASGEALEARTDVTTNINLALARDATGLRENYGNGNNNAAQQLHQPQPQPSSVPKRKGVQGMLKSPTSRSEPATTTSTAPGRGGGGIILAASGPSPPRSSSSRWPEKRGYSNLSPTTNNNNATTTTNNNRTIATSQKQSPKQQQQADVLRHWNKSNSPRPPPDGRRVVGTATAAASSAPTTATAAVPINKAAKSPPPTSILHKQSHYTHHSPPPTTTTYEQSFSPLPTFNMSSNPRVRFMSSGESVASTEASQVHLMAGGANSVASSSCMSSSADNKDNVFDRVLNMVRADEHARLNAMGMSYDHFHHPSPNKNNHNRLNHQKRQQVGGGVGVSPTSPTVKKGSSSSPNDRFSKVDAQARATLAAVNSTHSGDDDDLGLLPPPRNEIAPIDLDTGLEICGSNEAPIDADTGLELGVGLGEHHLSPIDTDTGMEISYNGGNGTNNNNSEYEYHDMNDEEVEVGMDGLKLASASPGGGSPGRSRSYDHTTRHVKLPVSSSPSHNRTGSDPSKQQQQQKKRASMEGTTTTVLSPSSSSAWPSSPLSAGTWGSGIKGTKKSPGSNTSKSSSKGKTRNFWNKDDFESDEWVAFDSDGQQGPSAGKNRGGGCGRVSDLATF